LSVFQNTTREVSLSFDIPASEGGEAQENLQKVERLIQGLYPLYQDYNSVPVITASPLWKIKLANFLSDSGNASDTAKSGGLLCKLAGFTFEPDLEQGYFVLKNGQSFPKNIKASLQATIFHNHTVGFDASTRGFISNMAGFPYGIPASMADKRADIKKDEDAEVKKFLSDNRQTYRSLGMTDKDAASEARRQAEQGTLDDYASQLKRIKAEREKKSKKVADKLKQQKVKKALQKKT
jgi:hypothetical protein